MRLPLSTLVAVLLASVFAVGCRDSVAPDDEAGVYVLMRIGTEALPATLWEDDCNAVRVISEVMQMRSNGTGTISGVREFTSCEDGHRSRVQTRVVTPFWFEDVDGRIEIEFSCGPNGLCTTAPHMVAERTSDGLRATSFQSPDPLHYALAFFAH